ncbi:glycerol-3-phosphate 1-O-acyltransferase PlsY [Mycoplasmatota bacterium WC30]
MLKIVLVLLAYLLGSIPFSYILGRSFRHEDIRKHGSGNIGTTNAYRVFGKFIGTSVLILDTLKSGLLVFLIKYTGLFNGIEMFHPLIYGFASVLGHIFPVWFKFKGGKGVATSFGLLLAYAPWVGLIVLPIFFIIQLISRYVSVASAFATLSMFITGLILYLVDFDPSLYDVTFVVILFLATLLIFYRHRTNFQRIRNGTESKIAISDKLDNLFKKKK